MLKDYILKKEHHKYRKEIHLDFKSDTSPLERMCLRFEQLCKAETPVILPDEKICFLRTIKNIPDIFTEEEWKNISFMNSDIYQTFHPIMNPLFTMGF